MLTKAEQLTRRMPQVEHSTVTEGWVVSAFLDNIVRLGTGAEKLDTDYPRLRKLPVVALSSDEIEVFTSKIDCNQLISPSKERYDYLRRQFCLPNNYGQVEQAFSVLCHPFFRKGSFETMGATCVQNLYIQLKNCFEHKSDIKIIVPTLPFKDQCAVTTRQSPSTVDLGERLFLMRLDLFARSLQSASNLPVSIQVVSDGSVYADIFTQNSTMEIAKYFNSCRDFVHAFNLQSVHMIDMADIIAEEARFFEIQNQIRNALLKIVQREGDGIHSTWNTLLRGMLFNCQLPSPFDEYEPFISLTRLNLSEICTQYAEVYDVIFRAGLEYASFLLTMKKLNVLHKYFSSPGTIRATVHPKPGQLGLHTLGSEVAPYNGVTTVNLQEFGNNPSIINQKWYSCQRFYRVLLQENMTQVVGPSGDTFCYIQE